MLWRRLAAIWCGECRVLKKGIVIALLVGVLLLGYMVAGPFLTMHRISDAIVTRDATLLEDAVDFETLRAGLTEQFSARIVGAAEKNAARNPMASLAAGFATTVVESMVNAIVTPAGIIRIIEESSRIGHTPADKAERPAPTPAPPAEPPADPPEKGSGEQEDVFAGARFRFLSPSHFTATMGSTERNTTRFVFRRDGLRWKLTNILLPQDVK